MRRASERARARAALTLPPLPSARAPADVANAISPLVSIYALYRSGSAAQNDVTPNLAAALRRCRHVHR